jgi:hypothetical protein
MRNFIFSKTIQSDKKSANKSCVHIISGEQIHFLLQDRETQVGSAPYE